MSLELDHVFVGCSRNAPEGDALVRLGLTEGSPNTHLGQGTANRRFFFNNVFLELLWVADAAEARSERTRRTRLWERCERRSDTCPIGLVFRPQGDHTAAAPFATWSYRPQYVPADLAIEFAEDVSLEEPELIYLPFLRRSRMPQSEPREHSLPIREITGVVIGLPTVGDLSLPSRAASAAGMVAYRFAPEYLLELTYLSAAVTEFDLRPALPLILRGEVMSVRV